MDSRELDRIRFVTRHFHELQGLLVSVPLGLNILTSGLLNLLLRAGLERSAFAVAVVGTVSMLTLGFGARAFYRRRFGHVERWSGQGTLALLMIGLVLLGAILALAVGVGPLVYCIGMSVWFVAGWVQLGAPASLWYRPILGVLLLGSLALGPQAKALHSIHDVWEVQPLMGFSLILMGLLDHRFLVRTMVGRLGSADEPNEEMELLEPR